MPPKPRPQGKRRPGQVPLPPGATAGRRTLLLLLAGGGLVVLVAVLGILLLSGGGSAKADAPKLLEAAGCSFKTVKALKGEHSVLTAGGTSKLWNTSPPTNGPHYETAALWGAYTAPLQPAQVVHNLEHGGIFVEYGKDVPASSVQELQGFYDKHRDGTLLAPLPSLGAKIALGVWVTPSASSDTGVAHLAECTRFDEKAYAAFFDAYQFQGPERFPPSSLTPGS